MDIEHLIIHPDEVEIRNYTVYSTEDIRNLLGLIRHFVLAETEENSWLLRRLRDGRAKGPKAPLVVVYWQGDRKAPAIAVRRDSTLDPERGGNTLRIKKPERLPLSPAEMLALSAEGAHLPDEIVRQIVTGLACYLAVPVSPLSLDRAEIQGCPMRLMPQPDLVEQKEERRERVVAKKVRKALSRAKHVGLRIDPSLTQLTRKVEVLEGVQEELTPGGLLLLDALRSHVEAYEKTQRAMAALADEE